MLSRTDYLLNLSLQALQISQCLSEVLLVQFLLGPPEAPEPPESHRTHLHPSGLRGRVTEKGQTDFW